MGLTKIGICAAVLILAGGMAARVARADSTNDPNIILHTVQSPCCDPPTTTDGSSDADPLIVMDESGTVAFTYEGVTTPNYFIEVVPSEGESDSTFRNESFICTDLAVAPSTPVPPCGEVSPTQLPAVEFEFYGPFLHTDGSSGPIVAGDSLYIDTPEPSAMLLLLAGLGSVLGLAMRRRQLSLS